MYDQIRCRMICLMFVLGASFAVAQEGSADPTSTSGSIGVFENPAGECQFKLPGKLTVPRLHHDLNPARWPDVNAPRILKDVVGDFVVQIKIHPFTFENESTQEDVITGQYSFVAAGLLVWKNPKTFVRLMRARMGTTSGCSTFSDFEHFWNGGYRGGDRKSHKNDSATFLRVTRQGDQLALDSSVDGKVWVTIAEQELFLDKKLKVGFGAVNFGVTEAVDIRFEDFEVTTSVSAKKQTCYWRGFMLKRSRFVRQVDDIKVTLAKRLLKRRRSSVVSCVAWFLLGFPV
jgi:hypothetical protein